MIPSIVASLLALAATTSAAQRGYLGEYRINATGTNSLGKFNTVLNTYNGQYAINHKTTFACSDNYYGPHYCPERVLAETVFVSDNKQKKHYVQMYPSGAGVQGPYVGQLGIVRFNTPGEAWKAPVNMESAMFSGKRTWMCHFESKQQDNVFFLVIVKDESEKPHFASMGECVRTKLVKHKYMGFAKLSAGSKSPDALSPPDLYD